MAGGQAFWQPLPGGGSGSSLVTVDDPALWPGHADDEEFDRSGPVGSLPTGWAWVNQSTSTYSELRGVGALDFVAGGSDESRGIVRAIPAGSSFTATFKALPAFRRSGTTLPSRHLILRDSTTSKLTVYSQTLSDEVVVDHYTDPTSFSSRPGGVVTVHAAALRPYVRVLKNSATSWDFAVSADGVAWVTTHTGINVSTHMTPNQIGIGVNSRTNRLSLGVDWYRVGS